MHAGPTQSQFPSRNNWHKQHDRGHANCVSVLTQGPAHAPVFTHTCSSFSQGGRTLSRTLCCGGWGGFALLLSRRRCSSLGLLGSTCAWHDFPTTQLAFGCMHRGPMASGMPQCKHLTAAASSKRQGMVTVRTRSFGQRSPKGGLDVVIFVLKRHVQCITVIDNLAVDIGPQTLQHRGWQPQGIDFMHLRLEGEDLPRAHVV